MDLSLPEMGSWEATRILKVDVGCRQIPIIALTAHEMREDYEKARHSGCGDCDIKPLEFPRLLSKIQSLLLKQATS